MRSKLIVLAMVLAGGCATARPTVVVEAVGNLIPSESHVAQAPVHATTDLSVGFQAVDTDETPEIAAPALEAVEAPAVAAKGGLVMGTVRQ